MNDAALYALLLAVIGLPVTVGGVALVARHLVERHADTTAAAIRQQHVRRQVLAAERPRELTR